MGRKPVIVPLEQIAEPVSIGVLPEVHGTVKIRNQLYHAKSYKYQTIIRIELKAIGKIPK